jgi:uracil-DNA glycosylase family 4
MSLRELEREVTACRRCPRLVAWREEVAQVKRRAFSEEDYWGRPLPGFGDPAARVLVFGLAPAAHGGNRTGRLFTGDRSGDFLMAGMHRTGFASQPTSTALDDGLRLDGAFITAAVRCAPPDNRPTPGEREACARWATRELALLPGIRVVLCLGAFAWNAALVLLAAGDRPRPKFGHGSEWWLQDGRVLLGSYHPSQHNTFTGRLTPSMLDDVLLRARELADL